MEDLVALRQLRAAMRSPLLDLEKRATEFQVACDTAGQIVGAIGFQMLERQGCIHSEAFADLAFAEVIRPMFWSRIQTLASNHGIARLWTQEQSAQWGQHGFQPADAEAFKKLPAVWNDPGSSWLTLPLKNEQAIASVEKELAMLMDAERQRTSRTLEQVQAFKKIATLLAAILGVLVIGMTAYLLYRNPGIFMRK